MVTYSVFLMGRDWMLQGIKYCGREKINPLPTPLKCRIWHKSQLLPFEEPAKRNLLFFCRLQLVQRLDVLSALPKFVLCFTSSSLESLLSCQTKIYLMINPACRLAFSTECNL